jgi:hypothetical protein
MCEFCHTHGESKKWYLQAKNYCDDLLSDALRRRHAISPKQMDNPQRAMRWVNMLSRTRGAAKRFVFWASTKEGLVCA